MQATAAFPHATVEALALDLHACICHLHRTATADFLAALGEAELSVTQLKLLGSLDGPQPRSIKDLAGAVGISLPAASRALDGLVQRGLVERREDAEDRRMKRVATTPAAQALLDRINASRLDRLRAFAETLTDEQRAALSAALSPIIARPEVSACRPTEEESA